MKKKKNKVSKLKFELLKQVKMTEIKKTIQPKMN